MVEATTGQPATSFPRPELGSKAVESDTGETSGVEPPCPDEGASDAQQRARELQEQLVKSTETTVGPRVFHLEIRYPRLYLLFVALNLLDLLITKAAINEMGRDEANVLAKSVLVRFGFGGFVLYKLFLTGLVVTLAEIISRTRPRWAFGLIAFGCLAMGLVVLWGAWHLLG